MSLIEDSRLSLGERVVAIDNKGRRYYLTLQASSDFQTHLGHVSHSEIVGLPEGSIITSNKGADFVVFRPTLAEGVVKMPRGAAVIYPKDAAAIVSAGDIKPGDVVVEVGAGSGALTAHLLRAVGTTGQVISYEARTDFAQVATRNVATMVPKLKGNWRCVNQEVSAETLLPECNVGILDLLKPWVLLPAFHRAVVPGGHIVGYVTTTTQMSELVEAIREGGHWFEPTAVEVSSRDWQVLGLSVRPAHSTTSHTGFLVSARRMANEAIAPRRHRRIQKDAYDTTAKSENDSAS